ncbi:hypothetical protein CR513_37039, partial [Mucuna pruriens]
MQLDGITPWFANIVNYLVASILTPKASRSYKDKIKSDKFYSDEVICRCIPDHEIQGHYGSHQIAKKVLDSGFYWPTIFKDAHHIVTTYE